MSVGNTYEYKIVQLEGPKLWRLCSWSTNKDNCLAQISNHLDICSVNFRLHTKTTHLLVFQGEPQGKEALQMWTLKKAKQFKFFFVLTNAVTDLCQIPGFIWLANTCHFTKTICRVTPTIHWAWIQNLCSVSFRAPVPIVHSLCVILDTDWIFRAINGYI